MWNELDIYNNETYIGKVHTKFKSVRDIINKVDEKYGKGKWTTYKLVN